jgi:hypothetical protein
MIMYSNLDIPRLLMAKNHRAGYSTCKIRFKMKYITTYGTHRWYQRSQDKLYKQVMQKCQILIFKSVPVHLHPVKVDFNFSTAHKQRQEDHVLQSRQQGKILPLYTVSPRVEHRIPINRVD